MTDSEILRDVGISSFLYDNPSNSLFSMLIKAMARARADERERCAKILNDRSKKCADKAGESESENDRIDLRAQAWTLSVIEQEILNDA